MNKDFYLDDYSTEDILKKISFIDTNIESEESIEMLSESEDDTEKQKKTDKPSFTMKPNYNSKGEKVVVFSINIPLKNNGLKIDILINNEMYKNMGRHFKK
jgi:isocitrate dehydrogenase